MTVRSDAQQPEPAELTRAFARHNPVGPSAEALLVTRAKGARVWSADGRVFLDFSCGGLLPLGYDSPEVRRWAGGPGAGLLPDAGLERPERVLLRQKLAEIVPGGMNRRVRLCDSGREALAAAVGLACRHTGRGRVVYLAESATAELDRLGDAAAVVVHPLDRRLELAAERCRVHGSLLVSDETRLAPGISGELTGLQGSGVRADLTVFGVGLGCGMPLGAVVTGSSKLRWPEGDTGGGAAACRVALRYLERLEAGLLAASARVGERLRTVLSGPGMPGGTELRGRGLVLVLGLARGNAMRVVAGGRARGVLVASAGERALLFEPPLVATDKEVEQAGSAVRESLAEAAG